MDADKLIATLEQNGELQQEIIRRQEELIRLQHNELAWRRYRDHMVDESPVGFALWLLLKDVYPFKWWYSRHGSHN